MEPAPDRESPRPKRLRVLFAIGSMDIGGSERQTAQLLRHLDRERFEPSLYLTYRRGELLREIPSDVPTFAFWDDYRQPRFNYPGRILRAQIARLADVIRRERIDVVCERSIGTTLVSAPAAKRTGTPRLVIVAADPRFELADQAKRFRWLKRRALGVAYRDAAEVVAVSNGVARELASLYGRPADRIRTIHDPVDLARIDRLAEDSPSPYDGRESAFRVLGVGRLHPAKGFGSLIQAAATLIRERGRTNLRVHLVGGGPHEGALRDLAKELGVADRVVFEGFQANPYPYFRHADVFCLSSESEGLGNVLLEAMACRIPVVSTDCESGPREILDGGKYGPLVPVNDTKALAAAIDDAMTNYPAWKARVEPARAWLESRFSIETASRIYETALESAAGR